MELKWIQMKWLDWDREGKQAPQQVTECGRAHASQGIVRLISQQPPAERLFFISISNGSEGNLFKWHANCCNGLFRCTSPAPAPLLQPLYSPFTLYYNDLFCSFLSLSGSTLTWAQTWEWQFNEKCFSIKQTKGENASINTHLQTSRAFLDGWDFTGSPQTPQTRQRTDI